MIKHTIYALNLMLLTTLSSYAQCEFTIAPQNTGLSCKNTEEAAVFTNVHVDVFASGNDLQKTGANGWNGNASSTASINNSGFASTVINETNTRRMFGLSDTDVNDSYTTIDFAIYLRQNGSVLVYENGSNKGNFGTYQTGDVAKVAVEDNVIKYYLNDNVIYTSLVAPSLPLIVDVSLYENLSTLEGIIIGNGTTDGTFVATSSNDGAGPAYQWKLNGGNVGLDSPNYTNAGLVDGDVLICDITPGAGGCGAGTFTSNTITISESVSSEISSVYILSTPTTSKCNKLETQAFWSEASSGLTITGNNLSKTIANGWNTGALTPQKVDDNGMAYTVINETNTARMFGLSTVNGNASYNQIDYAIYLKTNSHIGVYENGANKGDFGTYTSGDTAKIIIEDGNVMYYLGMNLFYSSTIAPTLPMVIDVSLNTNGATLEEVHVVSGTAGDFVATIINGGAAPTYQWKLNGGNVGANSPNYSNAVLAVNDIVTCDITPNSANCVAGPLTTNTSKYFEKDPNTNSIISIQTTATNSKCTKAEAEVVWSAYGSGVTVTGMDITKIAANGWNGGAFSLQSVADNSKTYTVINETNTARMFGLSQDNPNSSYSSIDYAIYLRSNGQIGVYENGSNKGTFGTYTSGDTAKVIVEDGSVFYYLGMNLIYTSSVAPVFPLFADVSINTMGGTIEKVHLESGTGGDFNAVTLNAGAAPTYQWQLNGVDLPGETNSNYSNAGLAVDDIITCNVTPDAPGCTSSQITSNKIVYLEQDPNTNAVVSIATVPTNSKCTKAEAEIVWTALGSGMSATGTSLTKTSANGWNGGAFSLQSVMDNSKAYTVINETNTARMFGLSQDNPNASYSSIDFAIYLRTNGTIGIYENGSSKGTFGTYTSGDTAKVVVEDGNVSYYLGMNLIYSSSVAPVFPLFVDVSINTSGATIEEVHVESGTAGSFNVITTNAGGAPTYQWQLNGVDLPGETNSNYTNAGLAVDDIITCDVTPDSPGCSPSDITSNTIVYLEQDPNTNTIISIQTTPTNSKCKKAETEVVWTNYGSGIDVTGTSISKNAANGWNGGAASYQSIADNGKAYTVINETNTARMFGLSTTNANASYSSIDFALYFRTNGQVGVYENGTNKGTYGTYSTGDTAKVVVEDGIVFYYIGMNLLYTSSVAPTLPMIVDVSINTLGGTLEEVHVVSGTAGDFVAIATNAGTTPLYQWQLNSVDVPGATTANYTNAALVISDVITCDITPDSPGCAPTELTTNSITYREEDPNTNTVVSIQTIPTDSKCNKAEAEVVWTNVGSGMDVSGFDISKTAANGWNGGAASYQSLVDNGKAYTVIDETNKARMFGLDATNTSPSYSSIDYAFYFRSNGQIGIYESGSNKGTFGTYSNGDTAKVILEDGMVTYYINQNLVYNSLVVPTTPLFVGISLHHTGATIKNVHVVSGTAGDYSCTAIAAGTSPTYQWQLNGLDLPGETNANYTNAGLADGDFLNCKVTPDAAGCTVSVITSNKATFRIELADQFTTGYIVATPTVTACSKVEIEASWTTTGSGVTPVGNNISKNGGAGWNGGGQSPQTFEDNGMAYTVVDEINTARMFGVSNTNATASYSSIDFAFYLRNNGQLGVYENGSNKGNFGPYANGDTLKVLSDQGVVKYYKNSTLLYTSVNTPVLPMFVDISLYTTSSTLKEVHLITGTTGDYIATLNNGGTTPIYQWKLNGANVGTGLSTYTTASAIPGDILLCEMTPDGNGCPVSMLTSNSVKLDLVEGTTVWNGGSSDWFTAGNWSNGVPTAGLTASIPNSGTAPTISGSNAVAKSVNIDVGTSLTIATTESLEINGNLNNNGTFTANQGSIVMKKNCDGVPAVIASTSALTLFNLEIDNELGVEISDQPLSIQGSLDITTGDFNSNNILTILSNATGEGRIGEILGTFTGEATVERYIDAGLTGWRYMTSPVSGKVLEDWDDDYITSGYPGSDFPSFSFNSVRFYDETVAGDLNQGYSLATNSNTDALNMGEGVQVWSGSGQTNTTAFTVDVTGPIYSGNVNLPITYTNTGAPADDGWCLVGNPFASNLNWDDATITRTNIDDAVYIWNTDAQQYATYVAGASANGGTANIAASQGFFVKANAAGPVLTVTEKSKTATSATYLKSQISVFTMTLTNALSSDQTVLSLNENANVAFEGNYDALKLYSSVNNIPGIASVMSGNEFAINQFPEFGLDIPIKTTNTVDGIHTLTFDGVENLGVNCVVLEDLVTGISYTLDNSTSIQFSLVASNTTNRFLLHVGSNEEFTTNNLSCFEMNDGSIEYERLSNLNYDAVWKDDLGVTIQTNNNVNGTISLDNVSAGTYSIEVNDNLCGLSSESFTIGQPSEIISSFDVSEDTVYMQIDPTIYLINQSVNGLDYSWEFGDGNSSIVNAPSHTYSSVGDYIINLSANNNNCSNESEKTITVLDNLLSISTEEFGIITYKLNAKRLQINIESEQAKSIQIYNTLGELIISESINSTYYNTTFDLSNVSNQILLIVIEGESTNKVIKIPLVD